MTSAELILALVTLQRAGELLISSYNTRKLWPAAPSRWRPALSVDRRGACRMADIAMGAWARPAGEYAGPALVSRLQGLRFWVMWTLGARWTTRIIVLPEQPLVSAGPYRFLSHPNYAVVAGEIAVLPLALGLPLLAAPDVQVSVNRLSNRSHRISAPVR